MIQFYINSRPVPRAIARARLMDARPDLHFLTFDSLLNSAKKGADYAIKFIAAYGVSVANI
ncbi:hypothetical protein UFOVP7_8 [uncultured Caudovirales phage]|uniref:Uncharacterized protein n=1 Tax=uncultured Caudovirales phage TaxID=2100421 RepID=A0A6J5KKV8_9CAUD|nr:hypothetical protein UFOVP7_8 [uncultured Caudovirales phage]